MRKGAFFLPKTDERVRLYDTANAEKVSPEAYLDSEYFSYTTLANGKTVIYPNIQKLLATTVDDTPAGAIDGVNTEFSFSNTVVISTVRVYLNGVRLHPTDYAVTETTLTLNEAPHERDYLRVFYGIYTPDERVTGEQPTGAINGANKVFSLSGAPSSTKMDVYLNGIMQEMAAYAISANTITFEEAPFAGDVIVVDYTISSTDSGSYDVTPAGNIDGVNTAYTLPETPTAARVYLNGIRQLEGTHYARAGDTITFTAAPQSGDWILVDYEL